MFKIFPQDLNFKTMTKIPFVLKAPRDRDLDDDLTNYIISQ